MPNDEQPIIEQQKQDEKPADPAPESNADDAGAKQDTIEPQAEPNENPVAEGSDAPQEKAA